MKSLIIYDATGTVWNVMHGQDTIPAGLPGIVVTIPDGASVTSVDVSDPARPEPVYAYSEGGVNLQEEYKALKVMVDDMALTMADVIGGAYHA